jgi:IS30 family transposase
MIGQDHREALVEHKSLCTVMQTVPHKTAKAARAAVRQGLVLFKYRMHAIIYDNGREFTDHVGMA